MNDPIIRLENATKVYNGGPVVTYQAGESFSETLRKRSFDCQKRRLRRPFGAGPAPRSRINTV